MESELFWHWAKRDALRFPDFHFSPEDRGEILRAIGLAPRSPVSDQLLSVLERTVSFYRARNAFEKKHVPVGQARRKVARLLRDIEALDEALHDLDWGTRRTLAPYLIGETQPSLPTLSARKPTEMTALDEHLCGGREPLAAVALAARAFLEHTSPKKGRPHKLASREAFVVDIADALQETAPGVVEIVTSVGTPFENIVGICLTAAAVGAQGTLRATILAAVKAYRGEYRPQGLKTPPTQS